MGAVGRVEPLLGDVRGGDGAEGAEPKGRRGRSLEGVGAEGVSHGLLPRSGLVVAVGSVGRLLGDVWGREAKQKEGLRRPPPSMRGELRGGAGKGGTDLQWGQPHMSGWRSLGALEPMGAVRGHVPGGGVEPQPEAEVR